MFGINLNCTSMSFDVRQFIRCFVAEVIATCVLIILASSGTKKDLLISEPVQLGLAIMVVSTVTVRSNGAFQNPCMAVANWATGYEASWHRTIILMAAEFCGGLLAAAIFQAPGLATGWKANTGSASEYLVSSIIASSMHVLVLLSILNLNVTHGDPMYLYLLLPILLGVSGILGSFFVVRTVNFYASSPMNPAFSLAVALGSSQWKDFWIDLVGPFTGSVFAALLHRFVFQPREVTPTTSL